MAPSTSRLLLPQPVSETEVPLGGSGLPLIWCPYCGRGTILELISKSSKHPIERFFKCLRKYTEFPICDFDMFEEEYANYLVHFGMLQESEMCHYRPLEEADNVQGTAQSEMFEQAKQVKKEPAASARKGRTKKKQGLMNWLICVGVGLLVLLGSILPFSLWVRAGEIGVRGRVGSSRQLGTGSSRQLGHGRISFIYGLSQMKLSPTWQKPEPKPPAGSRAQFYVDEGVWLSGFGVEGGKSNYRDT